MNSKLPTFECFEFPSVESHDWGYARSKRCVLMSTSAEWVQSVTSFPFELNGKKFIAPNRDYPYEGLLVSQNGENWKILDCVALALFREDGQPLSLIGSNVKISPWETHYFYRAFGINAQLDEEGGAPFSVSYYLDNVKTPDMVTGSIEIKAPEGLVFGDTKIKLLLQPFIDIRHMYSSADFYNYKLFDEVADNRLIHITDGNRRLTFYVPDWEVSVFTNPEVLSWNYKLGTGSRSEITNQKHERETAFVGEQKNVAALFSLQSSPLTEKNRFKVFFSTCLASHPERPSLAQMEKNAEASTKQDQEAFTRIREAIPLPDSFLARHALWARIIGLTKLKTYVNCGETGDHVHVPPAGAWWFKTPWYRDVFECILNSLETLLLFPGERDNIKQIILLALRYQDEASGLILNRIPEFRTLVGQHNSSDATLLCFIVANAYIQKTKDLDFASEVLAHARSTVSCFCESNAERSHQPNGDGPPRVDKRSGLLLSVPNHSWIDTRTQSIEYAGWRMEYLPNRVSASFAKDLYDRWQNKGIVEALLSSPNFFLPEVNAQWITMLKGLIETINLLTARSNQANAEERLALENFKIRVSTLLQNARENFKSVFWNETPGFLFNIVYEDGQIRDEIECEAAVTAAGLLGETVFTRDELQSIWRHTKRKLLVYREPEQYGTGRLPFGLLTKNEDWRIFYNDHQYHSDTIWPRSTPYLIKLLRLVNEQQMIRDILLNNLDHQMTECAIFYNQELFSRPFGNNAYAEPATSDNPVPVKNPIQLWSQWVDAYVEVFSEEDHPK
jgi:glycogen debranching enzyme